MATERRATAPQQSGAATTNAPRDKDVLRVATVPRLRTAVFVWMRAKRR
jgi:hypothetical protein